MNKTLKNSLELKFSIFVVLLLAEGIVCGALLYPRFPLWVAVAAVIGISVTALSLWILLKKLIFIPVQSLEKAAKSLAAGDLSFRLDTATNDEIGRMSRAVSEFGCSLDEIFQRMKNGSKRVTAVTEKVEAEFKNVSESTKLESEAIANIAISLEEMKTAAAKISGSAGRLAASTEEKAASMEEMVTSIGEVARSATELSQVVDSTSVSIEELSATIKEVASKSEELAVASEETLAASEEIFSSIKEVDQSAKESARLSEKVKNDASSFGIASVEKTIEGIKNIKSSFDKTASFMKKLEVRSNEIGNILNVIDEITDQTTLLALNAAILAAQAGEHGKGFSVVADEIKDLAERTSFSTQEIAGLIQAVQQEVKDANLAMEDGTGSVEEGLKVARDAGDALTKIVETSIQSAEMSVSIERSTAEQAKTTRLVSEEMEKIKNMVSQIAKTTLEQSKGALLITQATEKMRDVANHVRSATGEQLISTKQITDAIELVSDKSRQIAKAVNEQKTGSQQIFSSIEKIKDIPKYNMDRVSAINQSLKGLVKNTELFMKELDRIQLSEERAGTDIGSLKFGIEPAGISPTEVADRFGPVAEYLSRRLGRRVELKAVSDHEGVLRDLGEGTMHFCFLSPATYIMANRQYGASVLVKLMAEGKSTSRSVIVAGSGSEINSVADIKGHKFAFGDPHSVFSYIAPRVMLLDAGINLKDLLHYEYLGSDEEIIHGVMNGIFDAGGVPESIASRVNDKGIKFIQFSEAFPDSAVCVSNTVAQNVRDAIESAFTSLKDTTPEGASVLHAMHKQYSGFEKASDTEFSPVRSMMKKIGELK